MGMDPYTPNEERYLTARRKAQEQIGTIIKGSGKNKNEASLLTEWREIVKQIDGIARLKAFYGSEKPEHRGFSLIGDDKWPETDDVAIAEFGKAVVIPLSHLNMSRELQAAATDFLVERSVIAQPAPKATEDEVEAVSAEMLRHMT